MSGEPIKPKSSDRSVSAERPARGKSGAVPEATPSASEDIAAFVAKARATSPHAPGAKGRLVFALDATMSRQPTWDMACTLQADMFREAASSGSLDIRLVYYRGFNECRATGWISDSAQLAKLMSKIDCQGGNTQIGKVLAWEPPDRLVFSWRQAAFPPDLHTEVEVRFEGVGDETRVSVEHRGFDQVPHESAARHRFPDPVLLARLAEFWQAQLRAVGGLVS